MELEIILPIIDGFYKSMSIACNGRFIVVVGHGNKTLRYDTATNCWTASTIRQSKWHEVIYAGGRFIVLSTIDTEYAYSIDGTNWKYDYLPGFTPYDPVNSIFECYMDSVFYLVNNTLYILDSMRWHKVFSMRRRPHRKHMGCVANDGTTYYLEDDKLKSF